MNEIIVVNKEKNYTSRDIVNIVGNSLNTKKIGHTGTLDPIATGVMIICVGKATKLVELLTGDDKEYIASIALGIKTDTLDITGKVLECEDTKISKENIIKVLNNMKGYYDQEVPLYSAVKINGKKLYQYARDNKPVTLPTRIVNIKEIELISDVDYINNKTLFTIKCLVSKGTYIRSLIRDIAEKLNTNGVMTDLIRTKQGNITLEDANSINDIKNNSFKTVSIDTCLKDYYKIDVNDKLYNDIKDGKILTNTYKKDVVAFKYNNEIVAIYKTYEKDNNKIKPWKMLI